MTGGTDRGARPADEWGGPSEPAPAAPAALTVVITRPAGQSAALAAQLAARGMRTLDFPLIAIEPVRDEAPLRAALGALERYALVVFVSPNAVERALAVYASISSIWPPALPVAVVGPASVAALARHAIAAPSHRVISPAGSADEEPLRFDSESLYAALEAQLGAGAFDGKRVLIVRGDGGREWLAERLREAGAEVEAVAAYRRVVPEPPVAAWRAVHALLAGAPHAWLVTSSEGVRNLAELARDHLTAGEIAELHHAPFVVPHPRIAETARAMGFDRMTVSGAGDERIVETLADLASSAAPSVVQPVQTLPAPQPAQARMTDSNHPNHAAQSGASRGATAGATAGEPRGASHGTASAAAPASSAAAGRPAWASKPSSGRSGGRRGANAALLWLVVVLVAAAAGVGGYALNRKLDRIDQQLVQRQQAADQQTAALRARADQATALAQQLAKDNAQLEGKIADAQTAQQALAQQYADLTKTRDDWTLAEVGQMLSSASEQLQLTGNTQLALFALQSADTRLAASANPQAVMVRKAIAQDIAKLQAAPSTDLAGLAIKLDTAISQIDALPLAGEAIVARTSPQAAAPASVGQTAAANHEPRWKAWLQTVGAGIGEQIASLIEVRRIDNADAMLASPDQGYFVRENVKLRLLSARLSLLSRNQAMLKSDLAAADAALARYFDRDSKQTAAVREIVKEVSEGSTAVPLPNLDTSLQAVHQYQSRG